jgi:hypothetical protein
MGKVTEEMRRKRRQKHDDCKTYYRLKRDAEGVSTLAKNVHRIVPCSKAEARRQDDSSLPSQTGRRGAYQRAFR